MNLSVDPWIPIITLGGTQQLISLQELFARAHDFRSLGGKPHEKIALLRLLICITQAALDGPDDFSAREACQAEIPFSAQAYLTKHRAAFELFGDGPRFLQFLGLQTDKGEGEGNSATKLDLTLSTGNNSFFFDNAAGHRRSVPKERLALTLLTFQVMSPCNIIGEALWGGAKIPKCTAPHAPGAAGSMLHTFLLGCNLLETLHLNLLNKEDHSALGRGGWGQPVWEKPVTNAQDEAAIRNATTSYLGRLVPLSRAVWLQPGGLEMVLANGLDYPLYPSFREPAATVVVRDKGPGVLGVSLGRSIWRQLSAIAVKRKFAQNALNGPLALNNLTEEQGATLWIGALSTDKAKIEDLVEAVYDLPAGMMSDQGRKLYEEGIALAEEWQSAVWKSIKEYAAILKLEPPPYERGRQYFWTGIEQHVPELLRLAGSPETAGDLPGSSWGQALKRTARAAYEFACACQSPRQIEAFARGQQQLFLRKPKDPAAPSKKISRPKKPA